jgi:hypothetical protein
MKVRIVPCIRLVLALSFTVLLATVLSAAPSGVAGQVSDLPLPGGVAALLRAADIPEQPDPATAMLAFVRVAHVFQPKLSELAIRYLDAIGHLQAISATLPGRDVRLPASGPPSPVIGAWMGACGLVVVGGKVVPADDLEAAARRRALEHSGLPIADWVKRLNGGEVVHVEIEDEQVPLPLPADVWRASVLGRSVPLEQLAVAIFRDRRAALLYHGLMALDDETLAFLGDHPALVASIAERCAGVFAEWGRSIHVGHARVEIPGGDGATALWQAVVGNAPSDPGGFILALLERDGGRAAFLYDTITHLDPARRAFALGVPGTPDRVGRFRALYDVFARTKTFDSSGAWPVIRHPSNPAVVLREVMATDSGEMAAPASRALWEAAFNPNPSACAQAAGDARSVDAAWLVDRIEREFLEARAGWLGAVTFAQRVFGRAAPNEAVAACEAVAAYPRNNGLLVTLERMGVDKPADYVAAVRFAGRLWNGADRWAAVVRTAQVQGILGVLERAVSSRSLTSASARQLFASLTALDRNSEPAKAPGPAAEASLPAGAVGQWIRDTLLPGVCHDKPSADGCLIAIVSGEGRSAGVVSWEEERYRIDLGAATAVRIERVLQAQRSARVDDALNMLAAAGILGNAQASAAELERAATILKALKPSRNLDLKELFAHTVPPMRAAVNTAEARAARGSSVQARAEAAAALVLASDTLLADALVSLAYAMAIGDPDDAALMAGNPARRHLFDGTVGPATAAWHTPEEVHALDRSWLVEGSVLRLHIIYPRSWQRRISLQDPGSKPGPDPQDVRAFGETAAVFSPFDLTDASRDAIVSAIERGRAKVAELVDVPESFWKTASEAGLGEWRCRAALWANSHSAGLVAAERRRPATFFSLVELMRLGQPAISQEQLDAWGVATRITDGGPWVRMPHVRTWETLRGPRGVGLLATQVADVHLRVAEVLSELKLPAVLAPDIAAYAAWDAMTAAAMSDPDDWFVMTRAASLLPTDRFLDYVSALTAIGPLVPVR